MSSQKTILSHKEVQNKSLAVVKISSDEREWWMQLDETEQLRQCAKRKCQLVYRSSESAIVQNKARCLYTNVCPNCLNDDFFMVKEK